MAIADQAKISFKGNAADLMSMNLPNENFSVTQSRQRAPLEHGEEWLYNAEGTKVGKGNHDKDCDQKIYFCAGQAKYGHCLEEMRRALSVELSCIRTQIHPGSGIKQAQAVKEAIQKLGPSLYVAPVSLRTSGSCSSPSFLALRNHGVHPEKAFDVRTRHNVYRCHSIRMDSPENPSEALATCPPQEKKHEKRSLLLHSRGRLPAREVLVQSPGSRRRKSP